MENKVNGLFRQLFEELKFEISDYSIVDEQDKLLNKSIFVKNPVRKNYYLVLFLEEEQMLNQILEQQGNYFYLLKEFFGEDPNIEKNTNLLILLESKSVSDKLVFNLEENPYYFRKYILKYSDIELEELVGQYSNDIRQKGLITVFNEIINNVDLFEEFKKNPDVDSLYNFITTIFIKVSVLGLNVENKKIESLRIMIDQALEKKKLTNIKTKIDEIKPKYKKINDDLSEEFEINDDLLSELINLYE
ncbi:ABC-three component system middle component 1 [Lysinibacillus capsici]|uniref:ABC-three component system middle component 1 n=1 Tax=Lysinibacillus capsici TaxID=2115968 RepID=UPI003F22BD92